MSSMTISTDRGSDWHGELWQIPPSCPVVLIRPIPGAVRVTIDGKSHDKPMTADRLVDLAEDCLRAAIDMRRGE